MRALFILASLACLSLSVAIATVAPGRAQFKNRYTNLPPVTGFGSAGTRPQQQQQIIRQNAPRANAGGGRPKQAAMQTGSGVYPEYRSAHGVIRWIPDQMPLRIWVSNGLAIDQILDPALGAPYVNVDYVNQWPDFVGKVLENPAQLQSLPQAEGFIPQHRQAAVEGINYWKRFEKEGLLSFEFTEDPLEADIHVFFVHHFVNKLGLGLFASDIRGYTSKNCFPYQAILQGKQANFRPVVVLLRCTEKQGQSMPIEKMRAAAGHEMGHALGIDGHSKNPGDLMSMYYGNGVLSASDIATIRHLYKSTPDLIP
jgi:predicted Zn-dependent protease